MLYKFLGINIVNTLSWKRHIDQLLPKLNTACYAIRTLRPYVNQETLLMVCYAYFHSIMYYGITTMVFYQYYYIFIYLQPEIKDGPGQAAQYHRAR
jgi:hypothetical protein